MQVSHLSGIVQSLLWFFHLFKFSFFRSWRITLPLHYSNNVNGGEFVSLWGEVSVVGTHHLHHHLPLVTLRHCCSGCFFDFLVALIVLGAWVVDVVEAMVDKHRGHFVEVVLVVVVPAMAVVAAVEAVEVWDDL